MSIDFFDKYTFLCEMYSEESSRIIDLILNFFPFDNSIQIVDAKRGKNLVKRVQIPTIKQNLLQVGNVIAIFSKLIFIKDCAPLTRKQLFDHLESTFVLIKPCDPSLYGKVLTFLIKSGFRVIQIRNGKLDRVTALKLYEDISENAMLPIIAEYVRSGEVIGMELSRPNAVNHFREILGAMDPKEAEPGTLRALFGQDVLKNVAHGSRTQASANMMIDLFFGYVNDHPRIPYLATLQDCTCCVIKPHVMFDGTLGHIIDAIWASGKFYVTAMSMVSLTVDNALEFFEVYKGVLSNYKKIAEHMAEGKCVALEVKATDPNIDVVSEFRKLCGPRDPAIGRQLFPSSLRALYGKDIIHNAVHCTDLPEDGEIECEFFFRLLTCVNLTEG